MAFIVIYYYFVILSELVIFIKLSKSAKIIAENTAPTTIMKRAVFEEVIPYGVTSP